MPADDRKTDQYPIPNLMPKGQDHLKTDAYPAIRLGSGRRSDDACSAFIIEMLSGLQGSMGLQPAQAPVTLASEHDAQGMATKRMVGLLRDDRIVAVRIVLDPSFEGTFSYQRTIASNPRQLYQLTSPLAHPFMERLDILAASANLSPSLQITTQGYVNPVYLSLEGRCNPFTKEVLKGIVPQINAVLVDYLKNRGNPL